MDSPFSDQSGISRDMELKKSAEGTFLRVFRDVPPSHYLLKIQSFSSLKIFKKFVSQKFDAGDYKWKFCLYPNGDKLEGHISVCLELSEVDSLPTGFEINVIMSFFVFDQLRDKYFSIQDGSVRRYHSMVTEWGISEFLDLETFHDPSNGFLVNDTCVFGAEVFVLKNTFKGEFLSKMNAPLTQFHTWVVENFADLKDERYISESFGPHRWNVTLYPNGHQHAKGKFISIYLSSDQFLKPNLFVDILLRVKNQRTDSHVEKKALNHMLSPNDTAWGCSNFMSLDTLKDPKQGYLVNDSCIIEAEVKVRFWEYTV
ncbi:uncharacterized protein LOC123196145 isoform X2 [Mangifera indica]|uniref:uncharacterized protein LOC123196145 isoform X1 n=1 Tax=Mangifera indica TaxID=29780 RepID=UPI001CF9F175|nr:uncharacterized protein LOC123196145 isoform X1 [Mangifera indica]XP_044465981.1 uncharacterized protein LOC123196145 isoform X2 [Mangifera indica]